MPQKHQPNPDALLTFREVTETFRIPEHTVRRLFNERALPVVKIRHRVFVRHSDVVAYLDAQTIPAKR